jgi:hypothetical protein
MIWPQRPLQIPNFNFRTTTDKMAEARSSEMGATWDPKIPSYNSVGNRFLINLFSYAFF